MEQQSQRGGDSNKALATLKRAATTKSEMLAEMLTTIDVAEESGISINAAVVEKKSELQ